MSYKTKFFEWDVSPDQEQIGVPVGYEFEFRRQTGQFDHILYNLSTFRENAVDGAFFYSFDGVNFLPFPLGEQGFAFYTDYTMRVKISNAMYENLFALRDGNIYRLAGDASHIIEVFETALDLSHLSIDHVKNDIYAYHDNTLFSFYTNDTIRLKKSFNLGSSANEIIVDGARGVFWHIRDEDVLKRSLIDAEIYETYLLGSTIVGSVKKFLDKKNGNIVFSAETSSGYEIFELDFYSSTVSIDASTNLILDIDRGDTGYFVTFGNQYIGEFSSGILDETFIDTGRVEVSHVSGDLDIFYLSDKDTGHVVKFTLPYAEEWFEKGIIDGPYDLRARGNDSSVIYAGDGKIVSFRDDGYDLGVSFLGDSQISIELAGQTNPSHTVFAYRAVYGEVDLGQSSSSSSSSTSSSSQSRSESTSSEGYSRSSLSESEQSRSTESSSSTSESSPSSESSSSSSSLGFSTSSSSLSESSPSSGGNSESSSSISSEGFSESSSSTEGFSESSSSDSSEGIGCDCCAAIEATISGITGTCSGSNATWVFESDPNGDPCYWEAIEPSTSGYIAKDPTTNEWELVVDNKFLFTATTTKSECVPSSWVLSYGSPVCEPYGSPTATSTVCTDPKSSFSDSSISLSEESESVGGISDSSSSFGLDCVDGAVGDKAGDTTIFFSTTDTALFEVGDLVSLIILDGPCTGTYTGEVGDVSEDSLVAVTSLSPPLLCSNVPISASLCFIEDLSTSSSSSAGDD